jgi:signal transduction histidine kinase
MRLPRQTIERFRELLRPPPPDPAQQLFRLKSVERDIVLPIKALYLLILGYYFYFTSWSGESLTAMQIAESMTEKAFAVYLVCHLAQAAYFLGTRRLSLAWGQRLVFVVSVLDSLFLGALALVTGGFDSVLYWLFLGLIIRNAISFPVARVQIVLNLTLVLSFVCAGVVKIVATNYDLAELTEEVRRAYEVNPDPEAEPVFLRVAVLLFLTAACYGLQMLFEKARRAAEEAHEFAGRQEQLRSAGRLAAEIAHQIKNPLGIINNAAFALQRSVSQGRPVPPEQLEIIREEVGRADRIITELMGYAQLAEGVVERLNVTEELNRAIQKVFPPGAYRNIQVRTDYEENLPPLLMQRRHFSEIIANLLQNAREVLPDGGTVTVSAETQGDIVRITIADDGPGIPPEKTAKIFEPYFSTKPQGTGLGLAIVRHNVEIYSGRVRVESELGQGAAFILELPTRTFMKIRQ